MNIAIVAGVVILILVGFVTSYRTLRDLAVTAGGYPAWLAPSVPLSFDLGIVVLSLKVVRAAREGRAAATLRLLVALLSVSSVVANATSSNGLTARLLHAVPPAMFIVCFESVIVSMRRTALLAKAEDPRLNLLRHRSWLWLLAPRSTWVSWRHEIIAGPRHPCRSSTLPGLPSSAHAGKNGELAHAGVHDDTIRLGREEVVRMILDHQPDLTAVQLADRLADAGHAVSLRTAQRLKRRTRSATASPPSST